MIYKLICDYCCERIEFNLEEYLEALRLGEFLCDNCYHVNKTGPHSMTAFDLAVGLLDRIKDLEEEVYNLKNGD